MLLPSGCDAAYTIAVNAARAARPGTVMDDCCAVGLFVKLMNRYAHSLGMFGSSFSNPDGWDDRNHYSTVSDLIKLGKYAVSIQEIISIVGSYKKHIITVSGEEIPLINTNKLLDTESRFYCPEAFGLKTGTTDNAGCCILAGFRFGGKTYISAVMGAENYNDIYSLVMKLTERVRNTELIMS